MPTGRCSRAGPAPADETYTVAAALPATAVTALRLEALPDPSLPQGGPGRDYYGNFALTGFTATLGGRVRRRSPSRPRKTTTTCGTTTWRSSSQPPETTGRSRDLPPGWSIDATRDETRLRRQAVFVLATPAARRDPAGPSP